MWEAMGVCLVLSIFFLFLGKRGYSRWKRWRGITVSSAQVTAVNYCPAWSGPTTIDDNRSSTQIILELKGEESVTRLQKQIPGIVGAPAVGQHIPVYYNGDTGEWVFRSGARPFWILWTVLGILSGVMLLGFLAGGEKIQENLSAYTVESPNLVGSIFCGLLGLGSAAAAAAFIWGVLPSSFQPVTALVSWGINFLLNRLEKVEARCEAWIEKSDGDGGMDTYPVFSYLESGRPACWVPSWTVSRKRFQPGSPCLLYRDGKGRFALRPRWIDLVCVPLSLVPLAFLILMALSCVLAAIGLLWLAVTGLAACLLP